MHPGLILLVVGVPVGIGIAILATRGEGPDEKSEDVDLPENVTMIRTVKEAEAYEAWARSVDTNKLSAVGIAYRTETPAFTSALAFVATRYPKLLFVAMAEDVFDGLGGSAAGINLHCGEKDDAAVAGTRRGERLPPQCWPEGTTGAQMRESLERVASTI